MKKLLLFLLLFIATCAGSSVQTPDHKYYIEWNPVCRHKALYWSTVVGEQFPVRIMYGYMEGVPHVQPQIKLGDTWYYFKVERETVVLTSIKNFDPKYSMTYLQYSEMHSHYLKKEVKNGTYPSTF